MCHTSPEHVLPLQQLHDCGLRGWNQDDAAVLSPTHQTALRGDVHAGRHLRTQTRESGAEQPSYNSVIYDCHKRINMSTDTLF